MTSPWLYEARRKIRNKVPETFANVFVSRIGGFLEADQISSIILASTAQLSHLALQICGNTCQTQDLGRYRIEVLTIPNVWSREVRDV